MAMSKLDIIYTHMPMQGSAHKINGVLSHNRFCVILDINLKPNTFALLCFQTLQST